MRYNRIWMVLILLCAVFVLGGCMDVQTLSEEEGNMIAEYSAGVLLRYSDRYERRLITKEQRAKEQSAEATATPDATLVPATATPAPAQEDAGEGDGQTVPEDTVSQVSLNDLYHIKGLDFSYKSYQFCKKYPKSSDSISSVTAGRDETLLVVRFQIRNKSGARKKVNLVERANKFSYTLTADGAEYQPGISILDNTGLNYLNTTIPKGGKEEAVLVYKMAKDRQQASDISLRIKEGNNAVDIPLK